jgi:predicted nicotinamide N-methyase
LGERTIRQHPDAGLPASGQSPITSTRAFITANLHLRPVPTLPSIALYTAHPASRLSRLAAGISGRPPPYWAYGWAGGTVLAHHLFRDPGCVRGRRVMDFGAGSGIVAITAAKCGAASVAACDIDPNAIVAIGLNAKANDVAIDVLHADLFSATPPDADVVLAGDVFYEEGLARRMLGFLGDCRAAGIEVLIGDPRRTQLPLEKLRLVAEYSVPDFGDAPGGGTTLGGIFTMDIVC